jgi:L-asparagine transporter-like permease
MHLISAAGFFIIMGWMAVCRFTKTDQKIKKTRVERNLKKRRNRIYRFSGLVVWACMLFLFVRIVLDFDITGMDTFIGEAVALLFFGIAWLVKSKALKGVGL